MPLPQRKKNRLDSGYYRQFGAYFVTICTAQRKALFWANAAEKVQPGQEPPLSVAGENVRDEIQEIPAHCPGVSVEKYVIMPDHIHMILFLHNTDAGKNPTLPGIMAQFKGKITKRLGGPVWQKSFYDRIIRSDAEYQEIWKYIDENPAALHMEKW